MEPSDDQGPPKTTDEGLVIFEGPLIASSWHLPFGNVLWDAGLSLAKFFVWQETFGDQLSVRGKRILELGSGTGVVGLTLASLGATVTLTDNQPETLRLMQRNIEANSMQQGATVHALDWADESTYLACSSFDIVVAADVLYENDGAPFAKALQAHLAWRDGVQAFLSYIYRADTPLHFFEAILAAGMRIERLEDSAGRVRGSVSGQPPCVFDGSCFVELSADLCLDRIRNADFHGDNQFNTQIFRIGWPDMLEEELQWELGFQQQCRSRL